MLTFARIWLPAGIGLTGVVLIVVGGGKVHGGVLDSSLAAVGVVLLGAALIVWMINWLFRMSVESNRDREVEEEARRYFDRTGRWPGE